MERRRTPQEQRLSYLEKVNLKTNRAYLLKDLFSLFWDYRSKKQAKEFLRWWFWKATHSRLEPLRRFAWMLRRHEDGILAWIRTPIDNGGVEAMNNNAKAISHRARGYRPKRPSPSPCSTASPSLLYRKPRTNSREKPNDYSDDGGQRLARGDPVDSPCGDFACRAKGQSGENSQSTHGSRSSRLRGFPEVNVGMIYGGITIRFAPGVDHALEIARHTRCRPVDAYRSPPSSRFTPPPRPQSLSLDAP